MPRADAFCRMHSTFNGAEEGNARPVKLFANSANSLSRTNCVNPDGMAPLKRFVSRRSFVNAVSRLKKLFSRQVSSPTKNRYCYVNSKVKVPLKLLSDSVKSASVPNRPINVDRKPTICWPGRYNFVMSPLASHHS